MPITAPTLVDGLFQLSFLLHDRLANVATAHGLSLIQVRLLGILRDRQPAMSELAQHLELEKSSLSGLVDRAEERGLLERVPSTDDRRATTVRITPLGRRLARTVAEEVELSVTPLFEAVPAAERKRLRTTVEEVLRDAGKLLASE